MSGCSGSLLPDIEVAVVDLTKDTQNFVSKGMSLLTSTKHEPHGYV